MTTDDAHDDAADGPDDAAGVPDDAADGPDDAAGVPDDVADALASMDTAELVRIVAYVRDLVETRHGPILDAITPGTGEEIVRVTERDNYTELVKRQPCPEGCPECPHGPYLYNVHVERHTDGHRNVKLDLIGRVDEASVNDLEADGP